MRRTVLSPRWLVGHAVVVLVAVAFCRLGWWQWDRARETHWNPQYLSYALQWPLFAAFGIALWVRIVRDAVRPRRADSPRDPAETAAPTAARTAAPVGAPAGADETGSPGLDPAGEADDELAAYNRYLRWLDERDRQEQR